MSHNDIIKSDDVTPLGKPTEIWYGRKENEIHGWMQRYSGIPADEFNVINLPLTKELLDDFEESMNLGGLVPTAGFFFGNAGEPEQVREAAQELLTAAREALSQNQEPYYTSWW